MPRMSGKHDLLKVSEIFRSIQGEGTRAGLPCTMVRLAGCNLRCTWCDTRYAWDEGREMSVAEVLGAVDRLQCPRVELTGGEPLLQKPADGLLRALCDAGYETLLETNGTRPLDAVDPRVVKIVDVKCPSSGCAEETLWDQIENLNPRDEIKFVIASREDFVYARKSLASRPGLGRRTILFSPVTDRLEPATLAQWMLDEPDLSPDIRLGLQLHRIIWPQIERGV